MSPRLTLFALSLLLCHELALSMRIRHRGKSSGGNEPNPLCEARIVASACAELNRAPDLSIYETAADRNITVVHAAELAESLMVSRESLIAFLKEIGATNLENTDVVDKHGAFAVSCSELCHKTVQGLPQDTIPPASDVGCYWSSSEKICDIDLSDEAIADIAHKNAQRPVRTEKAPIMHNDETDTSQNLEEIVSAGNPDVTFADLQVAVSNWFKIWPSSRPSFGVSISSISTALEKKVEVSAKAYVTKCLQKMAKKEIPSMLQKWFGKNDQGTRQKVQTGMKHILNVVAKIKYTYHPNEKGYYGWVYSPYKQSKDGSWPIHFGGAYMKCSFADKVGTVTHEATHFYPLGTDDHLYCDVAGCLRMAKSSPGKAMGNADHWSFFIDDLNGRGMMR